MAKLDATNRQRIAFAMMRRIKNFDLSIVAGGLFPNTLEKPDLVAAINAIDDWTDAATASFVAALPQPFKSASTADQKTVIFVYVLLRRAGLLKVAEDSGGAAPV